MTAPRLLLVAVVLTSAVSGCGGSGLSPAGRLQDGLAGVVDAANAKDLPGLRAAIGDLRATVRSELDAQQIPSAMAARVLATLAAVEADSSLLTAAPASPTPVATPSPTPVVTTPPPTTPPPTTPPPTTPPPTTPPPTSPPPSPTPVVTTPPPTTAVPTATATLQGLPASSPAAASRS